MAVVINIAPSILSANFTRLADDLQAVEQAGISWVHIDVMDGHFVPNISIGPLMVDAVASCSTLYRDVHLMISQPERYLSDFVQAGAQNLTIHFEATVHVHRAIHHIKELGAKAGLAINPATPLEALKPMLPELDLILLMTVNPGFGGQKFIPSSLERIKTVKTWLAEHNPTCHLQVDGGINSQTIAPAVQAGADVLVAGSAVFNSAGIAHNIAALQAQIQGAS